MRLRARKSSVHAQIADLPAMAAPLRATDPGQQFAALPYRLSDAGELEILLITSRETRRWVIPKGWPMKGKKPHQAAAIEARQEAGVTGEIGKTALGDYDYVKVLKNGAPLDCTVEVFPLQVAHQRHRWREKRQRVTHWFAAVEAAQRVDEPSLRELILCFAARVANEAALQAGGPD